MLSAEAEAESNICFIIQCFKANNDKRSIAPNTVIFDTPCSYFAVRELDIALGNHVFRAQPTDYSLISSY